MKMYQQTTLFSLNAQAVIAKNIKVEEAMKVCDLVGIIIPVRTVYSHVISARKKGTYDVLKQTWRQPGNQ